MFQVTLSSVKNLIYNSMLLGIFSLTYSFAYFWKKAASKWCIYFHPHLNKQFLMHSSCIQIPECFIFMLWLPDIPAMKHLYTANSSPQYAIMDLMKIESISMHQHSRGKTWYISQQFMLLFTSLVYLSLRLRVNPKHIHQECRPIHQHNQGLLRTRCHLYRP